jgi:hypothetical protein
MTYNFFSRFFLAKSLAILLFELLVIKIENTRKFLWKSDAWVNFGQLTPLFGRESYKNSLIFTI